MKIYLAGKIDKNDWRHNIVKDLRERCADLGNEAALCGWNHEQNSMYKWTTLQNAIFGCHDYTGPFFVSDDHGCGHGNNTHGTGANNPDCTCFTPPHSRTVLNRCDIAIQESDFIFAWIDSPDAYGTLVELGMALAYKKKIFIAGPAEYPDMWLAYEAARRSGGDVVFSEDNPVAAFKLALIFSDLNEASVALSPIESRFFSAWVRIHVSDRGDIVLVPQHNVLDGKYRLDFAHIETQTAIELDGYEYHNSKEQFTKDRQRQRELERAGWRFIRFSGSEVYKQADQCARETLDTIRATVQQ